MAASIHSSVFVIHYPSSSFRFPLRTRTADANHFIVTTALPLPLSLFCINFVFNSDCGVGAEYIVQRDKDNWATFNSRMTHYKSNLRLAVKMWLAIKSSLIWVKRRDQLRWVVELRTGHCHLKGHLFKLGLTDDPICERCLEEDESDTHTSCMIVRP
jgi:hypothetical protein